MGRQRKTTTQKGLGWRHQQARTQLLSRLVEGEKCWWCAEPMYRSQELDADHSQARSHGGTFADRLLHAVCNRERGDGSRDHLRPALTGRAIQAARSDRSDWCLLSW